MLIKCSVNNMKFSIWCFCLMLHVIIITVSEYEIQGIINVLRLFNKVLAYWIGVEVDLNAVS